MFQIASLPFFSALLLLLSLPFAFHFLSGFPKKLGVNYGQSLEMGPIATNLLRQNAVDIQGRLLLLLNKNI